MSKVFYDSLVDLSKVEKQIKKVAKSPEERDELYALVDEIVHHKVLGCVLTNLPKENHSEFLTHLSERPHDDNLIEYLKEKVTVDIENFIKQEVALVAIEILALVEAKKTKKKKKR